MDGSANRFIFAWIFDSVPFDAQETNQSRWEKLPFDESIVVAYLRNIFARAKLRETISPLLR